MFPQAFIDGPNMDMVLGMSILGRRPRPEERPRWGRLVVIWRSQWGVLKPTFVLNGDRFAVGGSAVYGFRRMLLSTGYDVQTPSGSESDPVDEFIKQQLKVIARYNRPGSVVIVTHDGGYASDLGAILMLGGSVTIVGFPEEMSPQLLQLRALGARIVDLERDLRAFDVRLPRPRLG